MLPFWTALAAFLILGEKLDQIRRTGLFVILVGALLVGFGKFYLIRRRSLEGPYPFSCWVWIICCLFSYFSAKWAYSSSRSFNRFVLGHSIYNPYFTPHRKSKLQRCICIDIGITIVIQSLIIGILATILFNYGVRLIGASEMGAFGALTPILAMLGGIIFLNETVPAIKMVGIFLVAIGVFLASGILKLKSHKNEKSLGKQH